ncbi:hypothetical protein ACM9HF_14055 [Colwellia sp. RE-S-Sl-9]
MHVDQAKLIPHYFLQLKKTLAVLIICSLIPSLLLLPNVQAVATLWSWQMAFVLLIMLCFRYQKIAWALIVIPIVNMIANSLNITFPKELILYVLSDVMTYCLPVLCFCLYWAVSRIEQFTISPIRVNNIINLYEANILKTKISNINSDKKHENNWIKNVFQPDHQLAQSVISKLNNLRQLSKVELLSIAGGNSLMNVRGAINVIGLNCVMFFVFFQLKGLEFSIIILFLVHSGGILSLLMSKSVINFTASKSYLARLRLTPIFENEQQFNMALLGGYLHQQLMGAVVSLSIAFIFLYINNTMSLDLFWQLIVANVLSFSALTTVLLWGFFQANPSRKYIISVQIIISLFIGICSAARYFENDFLSNQTLIFISVGIIISALISLFVWMKKGINWSVG